MNRGMGIVLWIGVAMLCLVGSGCRGGSNPFSNGIITPTADERSLEQARQIDRIEQALKERDYATAEQGVDQALAEGSTHPRLYLLQGRILVGRGGQDNLRKAAAAYERAIGQSPRSIEARWELAQVYADINRLSSADSVYQDLDRLAPEHPIGPHGRGWIAYMQGRNEQARQFLQEALRRDPNYAPSLYTRSVIAGADNEFELQRDLLHRFLQQEPKSARGWIYLGEASEKLGRKEDARRSFERAWSLEPSPATARRLADLARIRGDEAAIQEWSRRAGSGGD